MSFTSKYSKRSLQLKSEHSEVVVSQQLAGFCSFSSLVVGGVAFLVLGIHPCFPIFFAWYPLDWTDSHLKALKPVDQSVLLPK